MTGHPLHPPSVLQSGAVLDGKYRVERLLAEGGMGVVVLAKHLQLERPVAIKFLQPTARATDGVLERFEREAKLAAQIRSEHVVRVHDVGVMPGLGPYMVMEYLEGQNLGSLLGRGQLPITDAVNFVLQACNALAEVHALGIVHRDIKPENLFLAHRPPHPPIVKLIDFGISKARPKRGDTGEWSGEALGTPAYMSPEQLNGSNVDARTDIWALGVVLYELVTGTLPFRSTNLPELCTSIVGGAFAPPSAIRPDLPRPIEAAITRCLEKDANARIGSVLELSQTLAPFGGAHSLEQIEGVALASRPGPDLARSAPTVVVSARRKSSWLAPALGAFVFLGVTGMGLALFAIGVKHASVPAGSATPVTAEPVPAASTPTIASAAPSASSSADATEDAPPAVRPAAPRKASVPRPSARDPRASFGERK